MDEEAVSPVIGVILMVAITVVLAALVFFVVQDDSQVDASPYVAGGVEEGDDRYEIRRGTEFSEDEFRIRTDTENIRYALDGVATSASDPLPISGVDLTASDGLDAGQFISLCSDAGVAQDVRMLLVHRPSGALVVDVKFLTVAPCV